MYLEQVTVFFNDLFFQKLDASDSLALIEQLGTFSIVDFTKIIQRELTFTYKVNKNTFSKLSSVTFFFWINRDVAETTSLRGRFEGNFRLKSKRCMELSSMVDYLHSIGFKEIEDTSEIEKLPISSIYPIFSSFQIHTELSIEIAEQVEELKFSSDFYFCPYTHTILVADRHSFSDPHESDVLIKTLFTESYFPETGIILEEDKVVLFLDTNFLESLISVPPSFSSFCDVPLCFIDPLYSLRPVFSKQF